MEIDGTRIGSAGPHSHTPETFGDDSSGNGHLSSYSGRMDVNHEGSDIGAPIYSNESSEMSVTTESHDALGPTDHSTASHVVDGHYGSSGAHHVSGASGGYDLSGHSQNAVSLSGTSSHMPHSQHHASTIPSSSILSHMPQAHPSSGSGNVDSSFASSLSASNQPLHGSNQPMHPSASGASSLASSSALTASVGGTMLSTGIGKKIKILAKKPDTIATSSTNASSTSIGMPNSTDVDIMNAHSYQMDADDSTSNSGIDYYGVPNMHAHMGMSGGYGYDAYGAGAYDANGMAVGGAMGNLGGGHHHHTPGGGAMRKRKMMPGEYELGGSTDGLVPATKKRAKMTGRGSGGAYSPAGAKRGGGTPSRGGKRGGGSGGASASAVGAGGMMMHPYGTPTAPGGRRQPPVGAVSSRRDLEGTAMAVCYDTVVELMERPEAPPFNQPVDPEALGIPNYHHIIKKPMDLRTVKDKVKRNMYRNAQDFVEDVRLIWSNATTFNASDSAVHQMALVMAMYFESRVPDIIARANAMEPSVGMGMDAQTWAAVVAASSPSAAASSTGGGGGASSSLVGGMGHHATPGRGSTRGGGGASATPSSSRTPRAASLAAAAASSTSAHNTPSSGGASSRPVRHDPKKTPYDERIKQLIQQVKSAENQLANLKKNGYNQALNKAIDALAQHPPSRTFEVTDVSALPYPLKASLAHILRSMSDIGHVREIVKILMQERFAFPRNGTEVFLDVDDMTPIMLRRIEHYIRESYPDGVALLETPAPDPPAEDVDDHHHLNATYASSSNNNGGTGSGGSGGGGGGLSSSQSRARASVSGPSAGTSASSTDESMLVDVMGIDAAPLPTAVTHSSSSSSSGNHLPSTSSYHNTLTSKSDGNYSGASSSSSSASTANNNNNHTSSSSSSSHHHHHHKSSSSSQKPSSTKSHHAMLDESDSDTSDSDSDDDVVNSNVMLRQSTRVLDIVPAAPKEEEDGGEVEIKNPQSWSSFDAPSSSTTTPMRPTTPGSSSTTPGGHGTIAGGGIGSAGEGMDAASSSASSVVGGGAADEHSRSGFEDGFSGANPAGSSSSWDAFRNLDAQNKQRDRERAELEEKQRKEREEREAAARAEEERKRKAMEEEKAKMAEEEKAKREAEIKARREAERARREASSAEQGMDMMEQSSIMHSLEREMRSNPQPPPPAPSAVSLTDLNPASNHPDVASNHPDVASNHPDVAPNHPDVTSAHPDVTSTTSTDTSNSDASNSSSADTTAAAAADTTTTTTAAAAAAVAAADTHNLTSSTTDDASNAASDNNTAANTNETLGEHVDTSAMVDAPAVPSSPTTSTTSNNDVLPSSDTHTTDIEKSEAVPGPSAPSVPSDPSSDSSNL